MSERKRDAVAPIDIDALLQNTWLQVISLRYGPSFQEGEGRELWDRCVADVERVQQALKASELDEAGCQHILSAQCALLDEAVKGRGVQDDACVQWYDIPLQGHFLGTMDAGDTLCDRMRDVLREAAPDGAVLTCFHRVMVLGFLGSFRSQNDPERQRLVSALSERVANVIADWTGVPLSSLMKDEQTELLALERELGKRVVGQDVALTAIAQRLRAAKTGLTSENGPQGVFLLVGPSGVGKTETALALADCLYGGEKSLITINLSEYQEPHTVSQLKGSPPGYVGYGQGGILTEAVRKRPYSIVLLDEVEKAHRDVMNLFYQVFDRGFMRDGEGREIDFRNTVILMTSNLGSDLQMQLLDEQPQATDADLHELLRPVLRDHFQPALLARFQTVIYRPLAGTAMRTIVQMKLEQVSKRLHRHYGLTTNLGDSPLPTAYLDDITQRRDGHEALQGFLDIFSHRILTQFYRIWRKYSYPATFEAGGTDTISQSLLGLVGLGIPGTANHIATPVSRFLALLGVLRQPGKTEEGMQALVNLLAPNTRVKVSPYCLRPVEIKQPLGFYEDEGFLLDGNTPLGDEAMDASSQLLIALSTDDEQEAQGWKPDSLLYQDFLVMLRVYLGWRFKARITLTVSTRLLTAPPLGEGPFWLGMNGVLGIDGEVLPDDIPQAFTTELGRYTGLQPATPQQGNQRVTYKFD